MKPPMQAGLQRMHRGNLTLTASAHRVGISGFLNAKAFAGHAMDSRHA
jgi:hypothetical protein